MFDRNNLLNIFSTILAFATACSAHGASAATITREQLTMLVTEHFGSKARSDVSSRDVKWMPPLSKSVVYSKIAICTRGANSRR